MRQHEFVKIKCFKQMVNYLCIFRLLGFQANKRSSNMGQTRLMDSATDSYIKSALIYLCPRFGLQKMHILYFSYFFQKNHNTAHTTTMEQFFNVNIKILKLDVSHFRNITEFIFTIDGYIRKPIFFCTNIPYVINCIYEYTLIA